MKNFYQLSLQDAFQYFIHHKNDIIPAGNSSPVNISVTIPVTEIPTDNHQEELAFKSRISQIEKELQKRGDVENIQAITANLQQAYEAVKHSLNPGTLVLYANDKFSAALSLPIESKPEVIIGSHFDTRPLFKARHQTKRYYILVISKKKIRLIEALNDKLVKEVSNDDFPFRWDEYHATDHEKPDHDVLSDKMIKEFFNISDKRFKKYLFSNTLPVVVAGDVKMISYYVEMMDDKRMLIGKVNGNYINLPAADIAEQVYLTVQDYNKQKECELWAALKSAHKANRLVTNRDEIVQTALTGNTQTLFVGENFSLKGKMSGSYLIPDQPGYSQNDSTELTSNIISYVKKNGGNVVFLADELLHKSGGMALIKRY